MFCFNHFLTIAHRGFSQMTMSQSVSWILTSSKNSWHKIKQFKLKSCSFVLILKKNVAMTIKMTHQEQSQVSQHLKKKKKMYAGSDQLHRYRS